MIPLALNNIIVECIESDVIAWNDYLLVQVPEARRYFLRWQSKDHTRSKLTILCQSRVRCCFWISIVADLIRWWTRVRQHTSVLGLSDDSDGWLAWLRIILIDYKLLMAVESPRILYSNEKQRSSFEGPGRRGLFAFGNKFWRNIQNIIWYLHVPNLFQLQNFFNFKVKFKHRLNYAPTISLLLSRQHISLTVTL